jgi:hypothetical protein
MRKLAFFLGLCLLTGCADPVTVPKTTDQRDRDLRTAKLGAEPVVAARRLRRRASRPGLGHRKIKHGLRYGWISRFLAALITASVRFATPSLPRALSI